MLEFLGVYFMLVKCWMMLLKIIIKRELEPTMECFWYLCSKIPSLDDSTRTILDENYDSKLESQFILNVDYY